MRSFGTVLDENDGLGRGFDTLRVTLSLTVILYHCFPIATGTTDPVKTSFIWPFAYAILPMFFALSGFLVTGSALRLTLGKFALSRILRIIPALAVDTLFTLLIIGPLLTTVPLSEYFTGNDTLRYLGNIVGEIHYFLPGMFLDNPYPRVVNGSLWTIPPELGCYILMAGLILTKLIRRPWVVIALILAAFLAMALAAYLPPDIGFKGRKFLTSPGAKLIPCFLIGALMYLLRYRIVFSLPLFGAAALALLAAGVLYTGDTWTQVGWIVLSAPVLAYAVLFLGLCKLPLPDFFRRGDYSYGIYLYGFSIQQSIIFLAGPMSPFVLFLLTIVPVMLLAVCSWHFVEQPTLRLRKSFSFSGRHHVASTPE